VADQDGDPKTTRMSFGDHLEELRSCLMRAFFGVGIGAIVCLLFGKEILAIVFRPLLIVQDANGLQMELQALAPTAGFIAYLKIGFLSGLVLTMPWVIYQAWRFVAMGLYKHERRFVKKLLPASMALFVIGVLFLYFVVLPVVLHFFITFNRGFTPPDLSRSGHYGWLLPTEEPVDTEPETETPVELPVLMEDPSDPKPNTAWVNKEQKRLKVATKDGLWSAALEPDEGVSSVHSQFAIDFYISFVLMLALAFGIAFEMPIVVFFLAWSGIVPTATMAKGRRYVMLGIVISAAIMTPPDVVSQLLLACPMYGLFELGLLTGRLVERR